MTPEQFRDLAIRAIERQIAAGSKLVSGSWGQRGDDGCPVVCGCALTLTVQDGDSAVARRMTTNVYEAEGLAAASLGLSESDAIDFADGFDRAAGWCPRSANHGAWHQAGADVAAMLGVVS